MVLCVTELRADLMITLGTPEVAEGTMTATVGLSLSDPTGNAMVTGYELAIDFGNTDDPTSSPDFIFAGFTPISPLDTSGLLVGFNENVPPDADYNGQLSDGNLLGIPAAISAPRQIGVFEFEIGANAPVGDDVFIINFANPGSPNPVFSVSGTDLGNIQLNDGSISIVAAIPEPSSLALILGALGIAGLKRRRS